MTKPSFRVYYCICNTEDWSLGLTQTRQAFYHKNLSQNKYPPPKTQHNNYLHSTCITLSIVRAYRWFKLYTNTVPSDKDSWASSDLGVCIFVCTGISSCPLILRDNYRGINLPRQVKNLTNLIMSEKSSHFS